MVISSCIHFLVYDKILFLFMTEKNSSYAQTIFSVFILLLIGWFYNLASVNSSAANIDIYLYEKKEKMGLPIKSQQVSEYK